MSMQHQEFTKGHGTENDFVIVPDPDLNLDLTPEVVSAICNRRAGIGGDGLLRVVQAGALAEAGIVPELASGIAATDWFMDYYNADGSIAEMCGNGTRVFAHWVRSHGLVDSDVFTVGTRAGAKPVTVHSFSESSADVSVDMGVITTLGTSSCLIDDKEYSGLGINVGNPHLAAVIPGLTPEQLRLVNLGAPDFDPAFFPEGVNVELVTPLNDGEVNMRVFERGVGETRSCGTGTVAAAWASLQSVGEDSGEIRVNIPGGTVTVTINDGHALLRGPSELVAEGTLSDNFFV